MLEIRKSSFTRSYENSFFREFSQSLYNLFETKKLDGVLLGSPICEADERLQIDALLLTKNVVCIIDFKNYSGEITLPFKDNFEYGKWLGNGNHIKGGSTINPFIQLKNQKDRFIRIYQSHIQNKLPLNDLFNPFHIIRIVCFQKEIKLDGKIPSKEELNFFILDKQNYLDRIFDLIDVNDKEVKLSKTSFDIFKEIFKAESYNLAEKPELETETVFDSHTLSLNFDNLYNDQKAVLKEIEKFILSDENKVFILEGTSLSGKSFLVPYIREIIYNNNIPEVQFFASSSRVATNLLSESKIPFNSIYSYIYGGTVQEEDPDGEDIVVESNEDFEDDKIKLQIVPLKKCDNEDRCIFIVDEAQLVSDSYHQSIDLRFGSGKLLKDLLKFIDLENSKRKIIFIGDSYQLTFGSKGESTLNPTYLKDEYKLDSKILQLLDKGEKSPIIKQSLACVTSIRKNVYNSLSFDFSENIKLIKSEEALEVISNQIESGKQFHLLFYSNAEAQKINYWIKKQIIKNGVDISAKDMVIFNNNILSENPADPFAEPQKIFNGQFGTVVESTSKIIEEEITPKGKKPVILKFRELKITLKNSDQLIKVLSLENFRLSERGELSEDEIVALRSLLYREIKNEMVQTPFETTDLYKEIISTHEYQDLINEINVLSKQLEKGEKVKSKLENAKRYLRKHIAPAKRRYRRSIENRLFQDSSTNYYRYRNAAYIKFGWALTVHKSMSYKWDEVVFNVDQGANRGKTNEDYFRWIYTGLTRSVKKIYLINYSPITPFLKTEFRDTSSDQKNIKDIYFISVAADSKLLEFNQFISSKIIGSKLKIELINNQSYQEVYHIVGSSGEEAKVSFYYNNKGHFKRPTLISSQPEEFGKEVMSILLSHICLTEFSFISDRWRKDIYEKLNIELDKVHIEIKYIIQVPLKDTIKLKNESNELVLDIYYDGKGFFSTIIATSYTDVIMWNTFKEIINQLN